FVPTISRVSRSVSSSSADALHENSVGGLNPPSLVNDAAGTGHNDNTPSTDPFSRSSNVVTWPRSAASTVPGANTVGPSLTSTACSNNSGGRTAPGTWACTCNVQAPAMPGSALDTRKHGPTRLTSLSTGTCRRTP